jgi:hypothetical protein
MWFVCVPLSVIKCRNNSVHVQALGKKRSGQESEKERKKEREKENLNMV